jgi:putative DNA primase/helicase
MSAYPKTLEVMDRLISEKEALAYCLPIPPDGVTDNNDLQVSYGKAAHDWPELQTLQAKLDSASVVDVPTSEAKLKPVSVCDVLTYPAPAPAFVWADYIPCGVVTLLGAHGGTGKSTMALMLAVCVAIGRQLFDTDVQRCKVLFVSLEDSGGIVRHRLAHICKLWGIEPLALVDSLRIVDGTESPELFSAEGREQGKLTDSYKELSAIIQTHGIGLAIVDNASDAFAGEEIQRRQVRAFIRALAMAVKSTNAGCLLLAHVDKNTSKARKAEGGEGYSGSTAWHNSARSRLFLTRGEDGLLTLEHQKSNLGRMREPITLEWPKDGLPQLVQAGSEVDPYNATGKKQGRADDESAAAVLKLMAEYESRLQFMGVGVTSKSNPYAVLQSDPFFQRLKLRKDDTKRIVTQCQRAGWIEPLDYKTPDRKSHQRWTLTNQGRLFAGLAAPTAPTAPTIQDGT